MRRLRRAGWGWALLLLAAGGVGAEPADPRNKLDERIDMTLKKAAPDDLFGSFAKMFGAEAVVDPALREPVSIELHNVRTRTLLNAICESIGCRWSLEAGSPPKLRVVPVAAGKTEGTKPSGIKEPIDLRVTEADGRDVLRTYGEILGADLIVDPAIKGNVTLEVENTPVDQTLDTVCKALGCEWSFTEAANGRKAVLRISAKKR
jgi:type II secretory pathway component GspD/PulD (secretin)